MLDNIFATQIIEAIIPVILIYKFYKRLVSTQANNDLWKSIFQCIIFS